MLPLTLSSMTGEGKVLLENKVSTEAKTQRMAARTEVETTRAVQHGL